MARPVTCYRCNIAMEREPRPLDLSWAGGFGGSNAADLEFRGILVEVHRCPSCAGIATRPVAVNVPERVDDAPSGGPSGRPDAARAAALRP
jgi:hypothetical protein